MDFRFTEEQQLIRDSFRKYLAAQYDFETRQRIVTESAGLHEPFWQETAALGWHALVCAEGTADPAVLAWLLLGEEIGRALVVEPYIESLALYAGVLRRSHWAGAQPILADVIAGTHLGVLAHWEDAHPALHYAVHTRVANAADGWVLHGNKAGLINGASADGVLVSAVDVTGELQLLWLSRARIDSPQVTKTAYPTIDGRRACDLCFDGLPVSGADVVASGDEAKKLLAAAFAEARLALAADMLGCMDILLDSTVAYAKQRKQFGVAIATFQSLQHMMADMYIAAELARSLVYVAAMKLQEGAADADKAVLAAKVRTDKSALLVAQHAIQIHGGIATTDELAVGHYYKRILVASLQHGSTQQAIRDYWQSAVGTAQQDAT